MPDTSIAMWAPAGTPKDVVNRLNAAVQKAMKSPEIIESLKKGGYEATPGTPEVFREQAVKSYALYKRLVEQTKLAQ
jgi:tripartite-type tricarboxylate transporter receptor subunit TctC